MKKLLAAAAPHYLTHRGHEGQSQAGPKGHQLEIGAQGAPALPVIYEATWMM